MLIILLFYPLRSLHHFPSHLQLVALPEALKDANAAIALDPTFVKAHIRKSLVLSAMREYTKAMDACAAATEADGSERKNAREIEGQMRRCMEEMGKERQGETEQETLQRAMKDPEVAVRLDLSSSSFLSRDLGYSQSEESWLMRVLLFRSFYTSRSCKTPSCETSSSKPKAILELSKVRSPFFPFLSLLYPSLSDLFSDSR